MSLFWKVFDKASYHNIKAFSKADESFPHIQMKPLNDGALIYVLFVLHRKLGVTH